MAVMRRNGVGFTLVELLVAITIASVLTVVALPRVREGLQQNAAARSATLVKSVFENARANAIRTGRPYGVILHRVTNEVTSGDAIDDPLLYALHGANYCKQLSFAQVAFDYRGDLEGAELTYNSGLGFFSAPATTCGLLLAIAQQHVSADESPIGIGSVIRLGKDSTPGVVTGLTPFPAVSPTETRVFVSTAFPLLPGRSPFQDGDRVTFSIETRPTPSPLAPIDLPGKVVVDLAASGLSTSSFMLSPRSIINTATVPPLLRIDASLPPPSEVRGYRDVMVMFNSSGQLDSVYLDQQTPGANVFVYQKVDPVGALSLLIGEIDGVVRPETIARFPAARANTTWPDPPYPGTIDLTTFNHTERKRPNFVNSDASWLSVSPSSGKTVLTSVAAPYGVADEISVHPELGSAHPVGTLIRNRLLDSRRLARGTVQ